jgi:hypothetical protein
MLFAAHSRMKLLDLPNIVSMSSNLFVKLISQYHCSSYERRLARKKYSWEVKSLWQVQHNKIAAFA